jgi:hypothetical protein
MLLLFAEARGSAAGLCMRPARFVALPRECVVFFVKSLLEVYANE